MEKCLSYNPPISYLKTPEETTLYSRLSRSLQVDQVDFPMRQEFEQEMPG